MSETPSRPPNPIWMRRDVWTVTVLFVICGVTPFCSDPSGSEILAGSFVAVVSALCASMGFWMGFGSSIVRFTLIPMGLCLVTFFMCVAFRVSQPSLSIFCFSIAIAVGLPIAVVRGIRRGRLLHKSLIHDDIESCEVLRFNIWQILVFTTAFAGILAAGKAAFGSTGLFLFSEYGSVGILGTTLGLCSVIVVWATLGKAPWSRSFVSCMMAAALGFLNYQLLGHWIWPTVTMVVWLEMTILMWLVRNEGYRFVIDSNDGVQV